MRILGRLFFPSRAAAPATPSDGEVWYDTVLARFRARQSGSVVDVIQDEVLIGPTAPTDTTQLWIDTTAVAPAVDLSIPIGGVIDYFVATLPTDGRWLWCNGGTIDPVLYPTAAAAIGANTPDLRGRGTAGLDNMGGAADSGRMGVGMAGGFSAASAKILGSAAGSAAHLLTAGQSGRPAATPTLNDPGHAHASVGHNYIANSGVNILVGTMSASNWAINACNAAATGITLNQIPAVDAASSHNNVQPTVVCNKIIRVK